MGFEFTRLQFLCRESLKVIRANNKIPAGKSHLLLITPGSGQQEVKTTTTLPQGHRRALPRRRQPLPLGL